MPLEDIDTGVAGIARLHCVISLNDHRVELTDWQDVDAQPIKAPEAMKQRLEQALAFIEEHRVCGNTKLCPADVIRIVQTIEQK